MAWPCAISLGCWLPDVPFFLDAISLEWDLILFFLVLVLVQPWPLFQFHRGRTAAVDTVFIGRIFTSRKKIFLG